MTLKRLEKLQANALLEVICVSKYDGFGMYIGFKAMYINKPQELFKTQLKADK